MVALANSLVPMLLGEKWIDAIELFQILSIYALIRSTMSPAGSLLLARGRADIGFWWSIGEFSLMPLIIYIGSHWGLVGVSLSLVVFQALFIFPNWYFIVKQLCNASFSEYFYIQLQPMTATLISVSFGYVFINLIEFNNTLEVIIFVFVSIGLYLIISNWLNKGFIKEIQNIFNKGVS